MNATVKRSLGVVGLLALVLLGAAVVFNGQSGGRQAVAAEPCAATEEARDPCAARDVSGFTLFTGSGSGRLTDSGPRPAASVEAVLAQGLRLAGASPTHLAIREPQAQMGVPPP
ncbi:MAG: hypothetical protein OXC99_02475 [Chloroflexi bacterium]|nr:hypothetical protein [Chloroflexota bacterium]